MIEFMQCSAVGMRVRIDQAGKNHLPLQVHYLRLGALMGEHFSICADGKYAFSDDRHRFSDAKLAVHSHNLTMV